MSLQRDLKIAERRRDVAELYLAGHTQVEIAHKWRVTQATISYDLKYIQAEWLKSAMLDFDRLKARQYSRSRRSMRARAASEDIRGVYGDPDRHDLARAGRA